MRPKPKRKFGEIPAWAKEGPITGRNYDLRAEWYGAKVKQWGDNWPFLSHDDTFPATADEVAWDAYFRSLDGMPTVYRMFRDGIIRHMNVPEARPELFDTTWGLK